MKLLEIVQARPEPHESEHWKRMLDSDAWGPLPDGAMHIARNQVAAIKAHIKARLREAGFNPKHFEVGYSSPRQAMMFPPATIRLFVGNRKSVMYKDETDTDLMPKHELLAHMAKGVIKGAFKEVLGKQVAVRRVPDVEEYMNGARYLDYQVSYEAD